MEKAKEIEDRSKQQYAESQHREKVLVRRLAAKEQEIQDYVVSYFFYFTFYILVYQSNNANVIDRKKVFLCFCF